MSLARLSARVALALLVCAGCNTGEPEAGRPDLRIATDLATCPSTCENCVGACFVFEEALPFCSRQCQDDRDCDAGDACASFLETSPFPNLHGGRWCVPPGAPRSCGGTLHCDGVHARDCADAQTLATEGNVGIACGTTFAHCANGCVVEDPDGGGPGSAHCAP